MATDLLNVVNAAQASIHFTLSFTKVNIIEIHRSYQWNKIKPHKIKKNKTPPQPTINTPINHINILLCYQPTNKLLKLETSSLYS